MNRGGHPGEVRVHVAEAAREREREPGVETVVVEHSYQVTIQRDRAHQCDERCSDRRGAAGRQGG